MKLKSALQEHREEFVAAINADFGHRSRQETSLFEMATVVEGIKYLHRNLPLGAAGETARWIALPSAAPRPLSAARRRRHHIALELSRCAGAHAARDGVGSRQPRHNQAVRADTDHVSTDEIDPGQGVPRIRWQSWTGDTNVGMEFSRLRSIIFFSLEARPSDAQSWVRQATIWCRSR